jgi:aspartate/glutamate racemase
MLGLIVDVGLNGTRYYTRELNASGIKYLTASLPTSEIIYELKIGNLNAVRRLVHDRTLTLKDKGCDTLAIACMTLQGIAEISADRLGMRYDNPVKMISPWISKNRPGVIGSNFYIDHFCQGYCQLPNNIQADIDKTIWSAAIGIPVSDKPFNKAADFFVSIGARDVLVACTDLVDICNGIDWKVPVRILPEIHVKALIEKNRY